MYKGRKAVGFQVRVRTSYYRGVFLSQLRPVELTVDGEKFEGDQIKLSIGGQTYEQSDLPNYPDVYWPIYEPILLTIDKPGGLELGIHDVEFGYTYTVCYSAPEEDLQWRTFTRKMVLAE